MLRGPLLLFVFLLVAPWAAWLRVARADESEAVAIDADLMQRIENLLLELDAEEFQMRELASKKLAEIGEPARSRLTELAAKPPSPEVRIRVASLLRQLDIAALRRSAVKLDDFYEHARLASAGKLDGEKLELQLERLITVLREATGNDNLKLPVKLADVKPGAADSSARQSLIITRRGRITFVRNSIVLADTAFDAKSVEGSIIIARAGVSLSIVRNSIVIAGYDVSALHTDGNSILLSSGAVQASSKNTVIAAGEQADVSLSDENVVFVNTALPDPGGREAPRLVKTDGLILRSDEPEAENPLADAIVVTAALGEVVLFRRKDKGGELVARLDQPIEHPDGGVLPETAGWQACYSSPRSRRNVVFTNGERFVLMPIVRP